MAISDELMQERRLPHSLMVHLQAVYDTLKSAERRVADELLRDVSFAAHATIVEMAQRTGSSEATLVRLARRLGYKGYPEMRAAISRTEDEEKPGIYENITAEDSTGELVEKVFESAIQALRDTLRCLDLHCYEQAVTALLKAKRILFCGVGDSYAVAVSGMQKFLRLGMQAFTSQDMDIQLVLLSSFTQGDVMIPVSYSGKTKSVLNVLKYAKSRGVTILSVTNYPTSPLAKQSDIVLQTAAFTTHHEGEVMSKRITQLAIMESLFVSLLTKSGGRFSDALEEAGIALETNKL